MKKEPIKKWARENGRSINITGIRHEETGIRATVSSCAIYYDKECRELKKFHPLLPVENDFIDWFIKEYNCELSELYYPPYNFKRTGCSGCPFSPRLQEQLDVLEDLLPSEKRKAETIWKPVYAEYRRIGYRLRKNDGQMSLF